MLRILLCAALAVAPASLLAQDSLTDLAGQPASLERWRGQVVLLQLWSTHCPSCRASLRAGAALQRELAARGLTAVAVNANDDQPAVRAFLGREPLDQPVLLDPEGSVGLPLGIQRLPALVLLDRDGEVRWCREGFASGDAPTLRREALALVGEQPLTVAESMVFAQPVQLELRADTRAAAALAAARAALAGAEESLDGLASLLETLFRIGAQSRDRSDTAVPREQPALPRDRDLRSVRRGYALDRAAAALRAHGIADFWIGLDDLAIVEGAGKKGPWAVVLPSREGAPATLVAVRRAIATRGSATVLAESAVLADALSAALEGLPPADGLALARRFEADAVVVGPAGVEATPGARRVISSVQAP